MKKSIQRLTCLALTAALALSLATAGYAVSWTGAETITTAAAETGLSYSSSTADENALLVNTSEAVTITDPTVTKSGDSDGGDNCNFYGINSAVMAMGGGTLTVTGGTVDTTAQGANGVFSYGGNGGQNGAAGDGTTVYISDTAITTTGSNSGGIMTTGGGVTVAENLTVTTSGTSSFTMTGGTLTSQSGHVFHVTNTSAVITLSGVSISNSDSEGVLLSVCDDGWSGASNIAELDASGAWVA